MGLWARIRFICRLASAPLLAWILLLSLCAAGAQTTIHIPADQPTIQSGIDAAHNNDTVLVAPGSYTENIDFKGKAITVTSGATSYFGAAGTILNGLGTLPTVTLAHNETRASVLNGFTIQDGTTTAVYLGSSATLSNNAIINNQNCAVAVSGARASPLIQNNRIAGTTLVNGGVVLSHDICLSWGPSRDRRKCVGRRAQCCSVWKPYRE